MVSSRLVSSVATLLSSVTLLPCVAALASAAPTLASAAMTPSTDCTSVNRREAKALLSKCYAMQADGRTRTFRLYVPATHKGPAALILVLHGGGGGGGNMEWLTKDGLNHIADREGALIAYPDGIGHGWNDGRGDVRSKAEREDIDDVSFLRALVKEVGTAYQIDPARVYATGISNGGLMSYRLACDAADIFAAVAPVAANMSDLLASRCLPSRPISMAIFNGTDDPIMPYEGGEIKVLWAARGRVLSTRATLERWLALDKCSALHPAGELIDAIPDDGTALLQQTAECAGKTEMTLYEIRGGGHTWPGGEPYLGKMIVGNVSRELDANEVIWHFFAQHPLR